LPRGSRADLKIEAAVNHHNHPVTCDWPGALAAAGSLRAACGSNQHDLLRAMAAARGPKLGCDGRGPGAVAAAAARGPAVASEPARARGRRLARGAGIGP
jgi:hypothetical protein